MILRNLVKIGFITALLAVMCGSVQAAGNISGYAWSENTGWANFAPTGGGVTVYADHLEGYAWNENIGWIRLGTFTAGAAHTYTNTSNTDYGVNNNGSGTLSGYGWSENVGWIKFNPSGGGVTIDISGNLTGYAWGENIGWIHFGQTAAPAYAVTVNPAALPSVIGISVKLTSVSSVLPYIAAATATGAGITERGFFWWIPPSAETHWGGSESGLLPAGGTGAGDFSLNITGLNAGTKYHLKAYIKVGGQLITSDEQIFTTAATGETGKIAPTVLTDTVNYTVSGNSITVNGEITDIGSSAVNVYGFVYAKHTAPFTGENMPATGDMALAMWDKTPVYQGLKFTGTVKNLSPGKWYLRAYAHNSNADSSAAQTESLSYGEEISFTIACTPETCIPGDVNGDGKVDLTDAIIALKILSGIDVGSVPSSTDVNGDHKIGLPEVIYVLQKVAGLRPSTI